MSLKHRAINVNKYIMRQEHLKLTTYTIMYLLTVITKDYHMTSLLAKMHNTHQSYCDTSYVQSHAHGLTASIGVDRDRLQHVRILNTTASSSAPTTRHCNALVQNYNVFRAFYRKGWTTDIL